MSKLADELRSLVKIIEQDENRDICNYVVDPGQDNEEENPICHGVDCDECPFSHNSIFTQDPQKLLKLVEMLELIDVDS